MRVSKFRCLLAAAVTVGCGSTSPSNRSQTLDVPDSGEAIVSGPKPTACAPGTGIDYEVGPGATYENIGDVPWSSVVAGDTVRIHARSVPYKEKITIMQRGTAGSHIKICGIADPVTGALPIIEGDGATSSPNATYPNYAPLQTYGLVLLAANYGETVEYIDIENLQLTGAQNGKTFTDNTGQVQQYSDPACIEMHSVGNVSIRNNVITNCTAGIFAANNEPVRAGNLLIEGNYIYKNGESGSYYVHNIYTEVTGITFQYNRIDDLLPGALGSCLKDRSAGTVVRYNWIRGCQRSLDLVEAQNSVGVNDLEPSYQKTYVYGNVLVYDDATQGDTFVHYGGDQGVYDVYRRGTLYLYNNTLIGIRDNVGGYGLYEVVRADAQGDASQQGTVEAWGNIFAAFPKSAGAQPNNIAILGVDWLGGGVWGNLHLGRNLVTSVQTDTYAGWQVANPHDPFSGTATGSDNVTVLQNPAASFVNVSALDFHLSATSPAKNLNAVSPSGFDTTFAVTAEYVSVAQSKARPTGNDAGAFAAN